MWIGILFPLLVILFQGHGYCENRKIRWDKIFAGEFHINETPAFDWMVGKDKACFFSWKWSQHKGSKPARVWRWNSILAWIFSYGENGYINRMITC